MGKFRTVVAQFVHIHSEDLLQYCVYDGIYFLCFCGVHFNSFFKIHGIESSYSFALFFLFNY